MFGLRVNLGRAFPTSARSLRFYTTAYPTLEVTTLGKVLMVTLNRPDCLNAVNFQLARDFVDLCKDVENNKEIHSVVLTGKGRAFCTGRDLKESRLHTPKQRNEFQQLVWQAAEDWANLTVPTVAAINGYAYGWGMEVALASDIRLSSKDSVFCLPETSLGIFPGAGGTVRLQQLIPTGLCKELIFTARRFTADDAVRWGLMNRILPGNDLLTTAYATAVMIANNGPLGVRAAKRVINMASQRTGEEAAKYAFEQRAILNHSEDFAEALSAFAEKRKPQFQGK